MSGVYTIQWDAQNALHHVTILAFNDLFMWLSFKFQLPAAPKWHVFLALKDLGKGKIYTWQTTKAQRKSSCRVLLSFDVEYTNGFVGWGIAGKVDDVIPSQAVQDGGYALPWQRYDNKKMAAICFLHLQQYSHRLNLSFNIGARRGCVVSTTPWPPYHWHRASTTFYRRLGWPQGRSGWVYIN